ncbi:flagellar hook-associated protein FlgK [Pseudooceanicola onchidii]|uniref:flagellar hook-associated protein FlgK n=1 Tax=Pseudooceanicola onchidii TaxID=2562279 RepID=UPI0010AA861E|nr:flagellar hook-associated protein FlgK [Pseudooceanicola onchidii]
MSISAALSNALSGLTASSRSANVISSNVANAMTEGYGRRDVELTSRIAGASGGVQVAAITRHSDPALTHDLRAADSDLNYSDTIATFRTRMEDILGTPEDSFSLSAQVVSLENSLITAASRPDLPERLSAVLTASQRLATTFNDASGGIQKLREEADAEIDAAVTRLNEMTKQVDDLNDAISRARYTGGDTAGLMDHRQKVIDEIAQYVPVREVQREGGAVALMTPGGAFLVDGTAADLSFTRTNIITPYQTVDAGQLSGLELNGNPVATSGGVSALGGGRLAALFSVRDDLAVEAQSRLDTVARDMVERFQQSGLDATRGPTDPGLFTDGGGAFNAADEVGISARISVNALVDPAQGGATWRLRDGLGAATTGSPGDSSLLNDLNAVLSERRIPPSGSFGTAGITASGLSSSLLSLAGTERQLSEQSMAYDKTRHSELQERFLADGVDTDDEMQRLMLVEQAYAANARVIQTMDDLLNILMGL